MYDEFERAVTGKPKQGIPVFGWILITLAFLFMFGIVGVGFAAWRMASYVEQEFSGDFAVELAEGMADLQAELAAELEGLDAEVAAEVADALRQLEAEFGEEFGDEAPLFAANLMSRLEPRLGRLFGGPAIGMALLEDLGSSEYSEKALRDILEGSLRIRTEDGELTADLWRGEDGGSLVIQTPDGEALTIDLVRGEGGGALVLTTEENVLRFGAGSEAEGLPGWVPTAQGMPDEPTPVFSASSEDGILGAVSWETNAAPDAILDFFRDALVNDGYRLREEHSARSRGEVEGGLWAENDDDDRIVFVAASEDDGVTKVLLGYGEERH